MSPLRVRGLAFPGLADLVAARDREEDYQEEFGAMMASEDNDGVRSPARPRGPSYAALAAQYPRAALYLRARDQEEMSSHASKAAAGRRAAEMLLAGASDEDASRELSNWGLGNVGRH